MNPPEKSDAELALENAQAVVRSALLQIIEMHHTLGSKFELLGDLLPSLTKLDKLTLIEGLRSQPFAAMPKRRRCKSIVR